MNQTNFEHILIITLISGMVYAPNLFGVPLLFDSWIYGRWIHEGKLNSLRQFYKIVGLPQFGHQLSNLGKHKSSYRFRLGITLYLTKIIQYISIYFIFLKNLNVMPQIALILTTFVILYPSNTFAQEFICGLQYGLCWSTYTISIALIFNLPKGHLVISIGIMLLAILLIIFSFSMKSLLFYSPIVFSLALAFELDILQHATLDYLFKLFMIFLPFCYWFLNEKFFPRRDKYEQYNKFISASNFPRAVVKLITGVSDAIIGGLFEVVKLLTNRVIMFSILIAAAYNYREKVELSLEFYPINLFLFGLSLTFISLIPYVIVNQEFDSKGYLTKNFIMCDVPFAMMFLSLVKLSIPQSWQLKFLFLLVFLLALYKTLTQMELWLQFSKEIILKQKIDLLGKTSDSIFYIEDMTTKKLGGKKDKIYPMTFYFLTNASTSNFQLYGADARFITKKNLKKKSIDEFNSLPLPLIKRKFSPKRIIGIRIKDGTISLKLLLKFMVYQINRDPFNIKEKFDLFQIEFFEVK